jgi:hypothetical protein
MPPWVQIWLSLLLSFGILSMHSAIASDDSGPVDHHGSISIAERSASSIATLGDTFKHVAEAADLAPQPAGESGLSASDCGGLAAVCLSMLVGASAYVMLRGRAVNNVLWQLSPEFHTIGHPRAPMEPRSPRERTSVLRR